MVKPSKQTQVTSLRWLNSTNQYLFKSILSLFYLINVKENEQYALLRTLTPRERVWVLEQIRYHGVQEDQHRVRRQRYERMLRHDSFIREVDSLGTTKISGEDT